MLVYDSLAETYCWISDLVPRCDHCRLEVENPFVFMIEHGKYREDVATFLYCVSCARFHRPKYVNVKTRQTRYVYHVKHQIRNATIVLDKRPDMKFSTSVFEAAASNKGISADCSQTKVIDHCKVSHDPNRNIHPDALTQEDVKELIDRSDRKVDDFVFDSIIKAKVVVGDGKEIEGHKTGRLEFKEDKLQGGDRKLHAKAFRKRESKRVRR